MEEDEDEVFSFLATSQINEIKTIPFKTKYAGSYLNMRYTVDLQHTVALDLSSMTNIDLRGGMERRYLRFKGSKPVAGIKKNII